MAQNNDVDVNTLIKLYNQKIATLTNQNILLEAKLTTVMTDFNDCLLYTSPSPRDGRISRMPSSA